MDTQQQLKKTLTPYQLAVLLFVYIFGDTFIIYNTPGDPQHGWESIIFASLCGCLLLLMYLSLYQRNGMQTLPVILRNCFGKYIGNFISLLYVLFFLSISATVLDNYSRYLILTNYFDTPSHFIIAILCIIVLYSLLKGIKVIAMSAELFTWILVTTFFVIIVFVVNLLITQNLNFKNLFPIGYWDVSSMLKDTTLNILVLFGQTVVFLMVFPLAGITKDIQKPSLISYGFISAIIVLAYLRSLLVVGGGMINRYVYAFHTPVLEISAMKPMIFVASAMSLSVLIKVMVLIYASVTILTEIFHIKNLKVYKVFILAGTLIAGAGGLYWFGSFLELVYFLRNIFPYYAAVFEVGIPFILFLICFIKHIRTRLEIVHN